MSQRTLIEWTDSSWNPVTGCRKVSPGCKRCYAERVAERLERIGVRRYERGFLPTLQEDVLEQPLRWRTPRRIFVCSMSDLLQAEVPDAYVERVVDVMRRTPRHVYQVLTKRPERLAELRARDGFSWPANCWVGTSIESDRYAARAACLQGLGAAVRWVSAEPLLGPLPSLRLDRDWLDWIVIGGETGPGARPMRRAWVDDLLERAKRGGVPAFFKQWGGSRRRAGDRLVDGRSYEQMPPAGQGFGRPATGAPAVSAGQGALAL